MSSFKIALAALACGCASFAQIQTGRISGTIFDPNKAVIPNAAITVTNVATNVTVKVQTNGAGVYVVPSLNPGMYSVSAAVTGFRTSVKPGVEMNSRNPSRS